MPTKYTSTLHKNDQSVVDFVRGCAKEFLPDGDTLEVHTNVTAYLEKQLELARQEYVLLLAATDWASRYDEEADKHHKRELERSEREARYQEMAQAVADFPVECLRRFMQGQLDTSAVLDCAKTDFPYRSLEDYREKILTAKARGLVSLSEAIEEAKRNDRARREWARKVLDALSQM